MQWLPNTTVPARQDTLCAGHLRTHRAMAAPTCHTHKRQDTPHTHHLHARCATRARQARLAATPDWEDTAGLRQVCWRDESSALLGLQWQGWGRVVGGGEAGLLAR